MWWLGGIDGDWGRGQSPCPTSKRPWGQGNEDAVAAALPEVTLSLVNVLIRWLCCLTLQNHHSALLLSARCLERLISAGWVSWAPLALAKRRHCQKKVGSEKLGDPSLHGGPNSSSSATAPVGHPFPWLHSTHCSLLCPSG